MKELLNHRILFPVLAVALLCAIIGGGMAIAAVLGDVGTRHGQINVQEPIVLLDESSFAITLSPGVNAFVDIPIRNLASSPIMVGLEVYVGSADSELYIVHEGSPQLLMFSTTVGFVANPGDSTYTVEFQLGSYYVANTYDAWIDVWRGDDPVDARLGTLTVVPPENPVVALMSPNDFVVTGYAGDVVTQDFTVHNEFGHDIPLIITAEFSVISGPMAAYPGQVSLITTSATALPGDTVIPVQFRISGTAFANAEYGVDITISRGDVT